MELPPDGSLTAFGNHDRPFKCPYVVYGDFEYVADKNELQYTS